MTKVHVLSFYGLNVSVIGVYSDLEKVKTGIEKDARKRKMFIDGTNEIEIYNDIRVFTEGVGGSWESVPMELDPNDKRDDSH